MSTSAKLDQALDILKADGRDIGMAAVTTDGAVVIAVDNIFRTHAELYELADQIERKRKGQSL